MSDITFINPTIRVGSHIGTNPYSFYKTFELLNDNPYQAQQIHFSGMYTNLPLVSDQYRKIYKLNTLDLLEANKLLFNSGRFTCVHGNLRVNLCGSVDPNEQYFEFKRIKAEERLNNELDIATALNNSGVVMHFGSCKDKKKGIKAIVKTIEGALNKITLDTKEICKKFGITVDDIKERRHIYLENPAGEGNKIGTSLSEIKEVFDELNPKYHNQVGVCIDTAHIFGAGEYDFGNPKHVKRFYKEFDKTIGLDKLQVFHFNDSRVQFNSKRDAHDNIGMGYQFGTQRNKEANGDGYEGLKEFVSHASYYNIPMVAEPPAKIKDKRDGPGFSWDYEILKHYCPIESKDCTDFEC
jgi:endonuclease IV